MIKVRVAEGAGDEGSPRRFVDYYFTLDGRLVVRVDEWEEEQRLKR